MSINTATISGCFRGDPELRQTASGASVLTFNVAVNERVPDGNGGWTDRAHWIKCVVFGKRADGLVAHLHKGSKVTVSGKLRQEKWEKDGHKHSTVSLKVDDLDFASTRQEAAPAPYDEVPADVYDAYIPF